MFGLKRKFVDDRGRPVEVLRRAGFCAWPLEGDRRIGVMRARVRAELAGAVARGPARQQVMESVVVLCAITVLWAPMILLLSWTRGPSVWMVGMVPWMLAWAAGFGYVRFAVRRSRRGERAAREIQREGLCASCGYNMHGIEEEGDGCVVCPECGAAWRVEGMRRREPFVVGGKMSTSFDALVGPRGRCVMASDDRGGRVVVPRVMLMGKERAEDVSDDSEAIGRVRKKLRRRKVQDWSGVVGWVVCFGGGMVIVKSLDTTVAVGLPVNWMMVAIGGSIVLAGLGIIRPQMWSRKTFTVRDVLREGLCPGCLTSTRMSVVGGDGLAECSYCGAAWGRDGKGKKKDAVLSE